MTVSALMIGGAVFVGLAIDLASYRASYIEWLSTVAGADLLVQSSAQISNAPAVTFTPELGDKLRQVDGVESIDGFRQVTINYRGGTVLLKAGDIAWFAQHSHWLMVAGDERTALDKLVGGQENAVVSESFASNFGYKLGDRVAFDTPTGPRSFPIVGIVRDFASTIGSVVLDRAVYLKYWQDERVTFFEVAVAPGQDPLAVKQRILDQYGQPYHLVLVTTQQLRDEATALIESLFSLVYAVELIAITVAVLGVLNTLLVSILDRLREIGILRAIGTTRGQTAGTVLIEAGLVGVLGSLLGAVLGVGLAFVLIRITEASAGFTLSIAYPLGAVAVALALLVVVAIAAGYLPARQAARVDIIQALEWE